MRFVSSPLWSLRPPTCEPELWLITDKAALITDKAALRVMRVNWYADDRDAFALVLVTG